MKKGIFLLVTVLLGADSLFCAQGQRARWDVPREGFEIDLPAVGEVRRQWSVQSDGVGFQIPDLEVRQNEEAIEADSALGESLPRSQNYFGRNLVVFVDEESRAEELRLKGLADFSDIFHKLHKTSAVITFDLATALQSKSTAIITSKHLLESVITRSNYVSNFLYGAPRVEGTFLNRAERDGIAQQIQKIYRNYENVKQLYRSDGDDFASFKFSLKLFKDDWDSFVNRDFKHLTLRDGAGRRSPTGSTTYSFENVVESLMNFYNVFDPTEWIIKDLQGFLFMVPRQHKLEAQEYFDFIPLPDVNHTTWEGHSGEKGDIVQAFQDILEVGKDLPPLNVFLTGHGWAGTHDVRGDGLVANIPIQQFKELLDLLQHKHTQSLFYQTCFAGDSVEQEVFRKDFSGEQKEYNFTIIKSGVTAASVGTAILSYFNFVYNEASFKALPSLLDSSDNLPFALVWDFKNYFRTLSESQDRSSIGLYSRAVKTLFLQPLRTTENQFISLVSAPEVRLPHTSWFSLAESKDNKKLVRVSEIQAKAAYTNKKTISIPAVEKGQSQILLVKPQIVPVALEFKASSLEQLPQVVGLTSGNVTTYFDRLEMNIDVVKGTDGLLEIVKKLFQETVQATEGTYIKKTFVVHELKNKGIILAKNIFIDETGITFQRIFPNKRGETIASSKTWEDLFAASMKMTKRLANKQRDLLVKRVKEYQELEKKGEARAQAFKAQISRTNNPFVVPNKTLVSSIGGDKAEQAMLKGQSFVVSGEFKGKQKKFLVVPQFLTASLIFEGDGLPEYEIHSTREERPQFFYELDMSYQGETTHQTVRDSIRTIFGRFFRSEKTKGPLLFVRNLKNKDKLIANMIVSTKETTSYCSAVTFDNELRENIRWDEYFNKMLDFKDDLKLYTDKIEYGHGALERFTKPATERAAQPARRRRRQLPTPPQ